MARVVKLRHGRAVEIGGAVVRIEYARRGEAQLHIDAPGCIPIRILPRGDSDARGQGVLPLLPTTPKVPEDDIPF